MIGLYLNCRVTYCQPILHLTKRKYIKDMDTAWDTLYPNLCQEGPIINRAGQASLINQGMVNAAKKGKKDNQLYEPI